jgi:hypothetical protein
MTTETQGKTDKDNINQDRKQTQPTELVSLKADVLDQTRLRGLTLSSAKPLFKRFGSQKCRSMLYIAGFLSAMKNLLTRSS